MIYDKKGNYTEKDFQDSSSKWLGCVLLQSDDSSLTLRYCVSRNKKRERPKERLDKEKSDNNRVNLSLVNACKLFTER